MSKGRQFFQGLLLQREGSRPQLAGRVLQEKVFFLKGGLEKYQHVSIPSKQEKMVMQKKRG